MSTLDANEVALGIESFGEDDAPLVLLASETTRRPWPDALRAARRRRQSVGAPPPARRWRVDDDEPASARLRGRRGGLASGGDEGARALCGGSAAAGLSGVRGLPRARRA